MDGQFTDLMTEIGRNARAAAAEEERKAILHETGSTVVKACAALVRLSEQDSVLARTSLVARGGARMGGGQGRAAGKRRPRAGGAGARCLDSDLYSGKPRRVRP